MQSCHHECRRTLQGHLPRGRIHPAMRPGIASPSPCQTQGQQPSLRRGMREGMQCCHHESRRTLQGRLPRGRIHPAMQPGIASPSPCQTQGQQPSSRRGRREGTQCCHHESRRTLQGRLPRGSQHPAMQPGIARPSPCQTQGQQPSLRRGMREGTQSCHHESRRTLQGHLPRGRIHPAMQPGIARPPPCPTQCQTQGQQQS